MYKINILSSEEFEKLPYKHVGEALGVADPAINEVFVRYTQVPELNKYLIDHEFDHLIEEVPTDEIDGVRYKLPLAGLLGGAASVASKALPAIGGLFTKAAPALSGIMGGAGNLAKSAVGGLGGALKGFGGNVSKGIGGALSAFNPFSTNSFAGSIGPTSKLGPNSKNNLGSGMFGLQFPWSPGASASGTSMSLTPGQFSSPLQIGNPKSAGGVLANMVQPRGSGGGAASPVLSGLKNTAMGIENLVSKGHQPTGIENIMDMFGKGMGLFQQGKGVADQLGGLFGMFGPQGGFSAGGYPNYPGNPQSVEELRALIQGGGGPMGNLANDRLSSLLGQDFNALSEEEITSALRQLEKDEERALDEVRDLYKNIRPGADYESDSSFRRDVQEVRDQFARSKADLVANRTRDIKNIYNQQQLQGVNTAYGASNNLVNQYALIAGMDIDEIMTQFNVDLAEASQLRQEALLQNLAQTGAFGTK